MQIFKVKRKTTYENRYSPKMGRLSAKVTYIKKYAFGIPWATLHKYRETYYGQIKDCEECNLYA